MRVVTTPEPLPEPLADPASDDRPSPDAADAVPAAVPAKGARRPLTRRGLLALSGFRRLLATRLLSQYSDGAFQGALASYVVFSPERQPSPGAIASAFAVMLLPFTLFGPTAGALLDRWHRRQILVVGNLLRVLLCLATAALVLGRMPTPVFYTAALLVTGVNRFVLAGLSAGVPHVVPSDRLVQANALAPTAGTVASAIGAGSALAVRLALPAGPSANAGLLVLAGVGYGASALAARTLAPAALGPDRQRRQPLRRVLADTSRDLGSALRYLRRSCAPARDALAAVTVTRLCYGLLLVTLVMLARNTFSSPDDEGGALRYLGLALGASSLGFFAAAVVSPWASRRLGVPGWLALNSALGAVLTPALGLLFTPAATVAAAFLLGVVSQGVKIATDSIVQSSVADAYRGRVFSLYDVLYNCALVAAAALCALFLPASGKSTGMVLASAALYAATAVGYWALAAHQSRSIPSATSSD